MTPQDRLERFLSEPYSVSVRERDGKYHLSIEELGLVAVGDDLQETYRDLKEQKQKRFDEALVFGVENEIPPPRRLSGRREIGHQLKLFVCKVLVLCLLGGLTLVVSGALLSNKLGNLAGAAVARKVTKSVVSQLESSVMNVSDGKRQEQLESFREFVEEVRPFAEILWKLIPPPVIRQLEGEAMEGEGNPGEPTAR